VNDQDLSVDDRRDGQKAENVLNQLEDLTAMSLRSQSVSQSDTHTHTDKGVNQTTVGCFINPMLKPAV